MKDGPRPSELAQMVDRLGPLPASVSRAMRRVPRDQFVPRAYRSMAYLDEPVPLDRHATLSAPSMVALQLEWAELAPGLRVLEIGSGSGYLLGLLAELTGVDGKVFGVELDPALTNAARVRLQDLGYENRIRIRSGDGAVGWSEFAPYDRIVASCAVPEILPAWKAQLAERGAIVAPVGRTFEQELLRWTRDRSIDRVETGPGCRFVPLRPARPSDI
ncbi:MAG: protein-L-isoaspartate O-methyltransferase [Thermoplasmata archaeon]